MECQICHKKFRDAYNLKRHQARGVSCKKTTTSLEKSDTRCEKCGKEFTTKQSMLRHTRHYCKQSEDGSALSTKVNALQAQMSELSDILKRQQVVETKTTAITNTINNQTTNVSIIIHPWDGEHCINVDAGHIAAAFTENARLREYSQMGDFKMANPATAPPYVTELLMDLVKRAHSEPSGRNVYLNPKRADQALALKKDGRWEVIPLQEATRTLFDDVVSWTSLATLSHATAKLLPMEALSALSLAGLHYSYEPDEYAKRAKIPMSAHLSNCGTKITTTGVNITMIDNTPKKTLRCLDAQLAPPVLRSAYFPPITYVPPVVDRRLTGEDAAALLQCTRPDGAVTDAYIRGLAAKAKEEVDYLVKKLWEAVEDKLIQGEDVATVNAIVAKYDEAPHVYV